MRCLELGRCSIIALLLRFSGVGPSLPWHTWSQTRGCSDFLWAGVCRRGKQRGQPAAPGQVRCLVPGCGAQLGKENPNQGATTETWRGGLSEAGRQPSR